MDFLEIKRKTFRRLSNYCSAELLSLVFNVFGQDRIKIDDSNTCSDNWRVTEFVENEDGLLLEKMKVLCAFDHLFGNILYHDEPTAYSVLCSILKRNECNKVLMFWLHTEMNGIIPFFEIGDVEIPKITPIYRCLKITDTRFGIEKKQKNGEYVLTKEYYPTEEMCQAQVDELNDELLDNI